MAKVIEKVFELLFNKVTYIFVIEILLNLADRTVHGECVCCVQRRRLVHARWTARRTRTATSSSPTVRSCVRARTARMRARRCVRRRSARRRHSTAATHSWSPSSASAAASGSVRTHTALPSPTTPPPPPTTPTPVTAKFHYTGPTGPDRTRAGFFCGPGLRETPLGPCGSPTKSVRVRAGLVGSGRARVMEFSLKRLSAAADGPARRARGVDDQCDKLTTVHRHVLSTFSLRLATT